MLYRDWGSQAARTVSTARWALAVLGGLLVLAGCSSSSVPQQSEVANTELHIYLDQCKQLEAGLYKCPAFDGSICDPEYKGQVKCIRTGRKGSIFVQSNATN